LLQGAPEILEALLPHHNIDGRNGFNLLFSATVAVRTAGRLVVPRAFQNFTSRLPRRAHSSFQCLVKRDPCNELCAETPLPVNGESLNSPSGYFGALMKMAAKDLSTARAEPVTIQKHGRPLVDHHPSLGDK
jgi:hypothetical protein